MDKFWQKMISTCLDAEDKLTDWEWDFLNDIADEEGELTPKQREVLKKIYHKVEWRD